jgi:hypothetical protein
VEVYFSAVGGGGGGGGVIIIAHFEKNKIHTLFSHISFPHETFVFVCALC